MNKNEQVDLSFDLVLGVKKALDPLLTPEEILKEIGLDKYSLPEALELIEDRVKTAAKDLDRQSDEKGWWDESSFNIYVNALILKLIAQYAWMGKHYQFMLSEQQSRE